MKIVPASYTIMPDDLSLTERLERCGRIPYKSEDKITEESAVPFIERMFKRNHRPVFDMAAVHVCFSIEGDVDYAKLWIDPTPGYSKYLQVSPVEHRKDKEKLYCIMSGSVRAWIEYLENHTHYAEDFKHALFNYSPECFSMFANATREEDDGEPPVVSSSLFDFPVELPGNIIKKHHYVGVHFIVNRAVSHELVRHRPCGFLQESQRYCNYSQNKFGNEVEFIDPAALQYNDDQIGTWIYAMQQAEMAYIHLIKSGCTAQQARTVLPNSCKTEIVVYCTLEQWEHIFSLRRSSAADPSMREVMVPLGLEMKEKFPMINLEKKPYVKGE